MSAVRVVTCLRPCLGYSARGKRWTIHRAKPSWLAPVGLESQQGIAEAIIDHIPAPELDASAPLQALITTLDYSDYVGRIGIGRVFAGTLQAKHDVAVLDRHGNRTTQRVAQLFREADRRRQACKLATANA